MWRVKRVVHFLLLLLQLFLSFSPTHSICGVPLADEPLCPPPNRSATLRFLNISGTLPNDIDCPNSYPTQISHSSGYTFLQCCAEGFEKVDWYYAWPEETLNFQQRECEVTFANSTTFTIKNPIIIDAGFYKCRLTSRDGRSIERIQRVYLDESNTFDKSITTSFAENCRTSNRLTPLHGDRIEVACTIRTSFRPDSLLQLRFQTRHAFNHSTCTIRPLCGRLKLRSKPSQAIDVASSSCIVPDANWRLQAIVASKAEEVEVRLTLSAVTEATELTLSAWGKGESPIDMKFMILPQPRFRLVLWMIIVLASSLLVVILVIVVSHVFWLDLRLLSKQCFNSFQEDSIKIEVSVMSGSDGLTNASKKFVKNLTQYLRENLSSKEFNILPCGPLDGSDISAVNAEIEECRSDAESDIFIILLDNSVIRNERFVDQIKKLMPRPKKESSTHGTLGRQNYERSQQIYVVMESLKSTEGEFSVLDFLMSQIRFNSVVRYQWRPKSWVLRQIRLSLELARLQEMKKRPSPPRVDETSPLLENSE